MRCTTEATEQKSHVRTQLVSRTQSRNKSSGVSLPSLEEVVAAAPRPAAGSCTARRTCAATRCSTKRLFCLHERKRESASRSRASERFAGAGFWLFATERLSATLPLACWTCVLPTGCAFLPWRRGTWDSRCLDVTRVWWFGDCIHSLSRSG